MANGNTYQDYVNIIAGDPSGQISMYGDRASAAIAQHKAKVDIIEMINKAIADTESSGDGWGLLGDLIFGGGVDEISKLLTTNPIARGAINVGSKLLKNLAQQGNTKELEKVIAKLGPRAIAKDVKEVKEDIDEQLDADLLNKAISDITSEIIFSTDTVKTVSDVDEDAVNKLVSDITSGDTANLLNEAEVVGDFVPTGVGGAPIETAHSTIDSQLTYNTPSIDYTTDLNIQDIVRETSKEDFIKNAGIFGGGEKITKEVADSIIAERVSDDSLFSSVVPYGSELMGNEWFRWLYDKPIAHSLMKNLYTPLMTDTGIGYQGRFSKPRFTNPWRRRG